MQNLVSLTRVSYNSLLMTIGLTLCGCQLIVPGPLFGQVVLRPPIDSSVQVTVEADKQSESSPPFGNPEKTAVLPASDERLEFFGNQPVFDGVASDPIFSEQDNSRGREGLTITQRILLDHQNYYSPESLTILGAGLVVGGAMANSSIDNEIHRRFQSSVRSANSDDWFESLHSSKEVGNGKYTLPVFAASWAVGELYPDSPMAKTTGTWGERSLRGILVGAPPLLALQQLTGGSRPTETSEGPEWHPLTDNNGISGHSFMGSLPFITAAKMTESRSLKATYYAASTIVPLSRMNDNAHYPSQVALGWWMAFLAASAVDATDHPDSQWRWYPYSTGDSSGILAEFKY